ncbi:hypothetical protein MAN88_08190 [Microcystis aeruginosa]|nr:hypothetical protein MAN88_08190 [Microcystis aeruginosa]
MPPYRTIPSNEEPNLTGYQLPSGTIITTDDNPSKPDAELKDNGQ